jgi:hypothetical protein
MSRPDYRALFKYRAIDDHFHEFVRDAELFFPNRHQLNDPDEALIRFDRQKTISEQVLDADPSADFVIQTIEPRYLGVDNFFFFCLSRRKDDVLMWSHYAANHTGLCLEFDFSSCSRRFQNPDQLHLPRFLDFDESISIADVKYLQAIPMYILEPNGLDPAFSSEENEFFGYTKLSCWEQEAEVRLRLRTEPQKRSFPKGLLKAVHFGLRVDELLRKKTMLEMKDAGYNCRFSGATGIELVAGRHAVVFKEVPSGRSG